MSPSQSDREDEELKLTDPTQLNVLDRKLSDRVPLLYYSSPSITHIHGASKEWRGPEKMLFKFGSKY